MARSLHTTVAAFLLCAIPVASALAAQTEDPKKFNYRPLPVDVSCLSGYHPTIDKDGNKVFPCVEDAAKVAPVNTTPIKSAPVAVKPQ